MDSTKETVARDNLYAGPYPVVKGEVTIAESQELARGAVLGIVTASGEAVLLDKDADDGSQNFNAILLDPVTTGEGETQVAPVALSGEFQVQALSFADGTDADDVKAAARALNCYIKTSYADANVIGG